MTLYGKKNATFCAISIYKMHLFYQDRLGTYIGKVEKRVAFFLGHDSPQDYADLVEYCWGDNSTEWGKLRHEDGHPAEYELSRVEIGNEEYNSVRKNAFLEAHFLRTCSLRNDHLSRQAQDKHIRNDNSVNFRTKTGCCFRTGFRSGSVGNGGEGDAARPSKGAILPLSVAALQLP